MGDWEVVRDALDEAGLPSAGFGQFTSGRHAEVIRPEKFDHQHSVPVLLSCLDRVRDPRVKEAIVRALSTGFAKPAAAPALIAEFVATSDADDPALKWAIGNALDVVAEQSHVSQLIVLAADPTHGKGRQMIVSRIGRSKHTSETATTLLDLLDDPDVSLHAMSALRSQIGPERALPYIEPLLDAPSDQVRRNAKKHVNAINRARIRPSK